MRRPSSRSPAAGLRAAALLLLLALAGCNLTLAELAAVSARKVHDQRPHEIFYPRVTGESCPHWWRRWFLGDDATLDRAIDAALAQHPDANALVLVEVEERKECFTVSGFAAVVR